MILFLRLFADCETEEQAQAIADRVGLSLHRLAPREFAPPKRYWKISSQFEFTFTLESPTSLSFKSIIEASSGGWAHQETGVEMLAIWSRHGDHVFLTPEVGWANVELHEEAP
ncbi:hypothetical protein AACH06_29215 [Ideonella sp. DXS29W]|uniref:Uncharacterized protein n=1 Tax=Ideonella lacteola TaxID=2984193 RepID=A0ABU9BY65_9BURK